MWEVWSEDRQKLLARVTTLKAAQAVLRLLDDDPTTWIRWTQ